MKARRAFLIYLNRFATMKLILFLMERAITLGKGCKSDPVQYSEQIQISKRAKVRMVEKV